MSLHWALVCVAGVGAAALAWAIQRAFYDALDRYGQVYTVAAEQRLRDLFLFVDLRLLWPIAMLCSLVLASLVLLAGGGWLLALLLAAGCLLAPKALLMWAKAQRLRAFEAQLPDALNALACDMRAGSSLSVALQSLAQHAAAPLGQEFAVVNREIRLGVSVPDSMSQLASRLPGPAMRMLAATVRVATRTGGPMAVMLEQTALALTANQQIRQKRAALMAQGWLQAWVMGAMPPGLMAILSRMDDAFAHGLLETTMGQMVVLTVVGLECLGIGWLLRIAKSGQVG